MPIYAQGVPHGGYAQAQPMMMMPGQPPPPPRWPAPTYAAPRQNPSAQVGAPRPAPPAQVAAPRPSTFTPQPIVRGVPKEERSLAMPAPESLNILSTREKAPVDWTNIRGQLNRAGATGFQLETLPQGGFRFVCLVPDSNNRPQRVEGQGGDEAEAIQRCLAQVSR